MCQANMHLLQLEDHYQLIKDTLMKFSQSNTLSDMTIITGKRAFPAHRLLLSTFTSFFNDLLVNDDNSPTCQRYIVLNDMNELVFEKVLKLIYDGAVHICDSIAQDFIKVADMLKLKSFQTATTDVLENKVTLFTLSCHKDTILENLWGSLPTFLCDVTFVPSNLTLCHVHSLVISAHSEYLLNIFLKRKAANKPLTFVLENVKEEHLKCVIEYCYKGSVVVPQDALHDVYEVASILGIETLCSRILNVDPSIMIPQISASSAEIVSTIQSRHYGETENATCRKNIFSLVMENEHLVDCTVIAGNGTHNIHLAALSELSPYFRNLTNTFLNIKDSCVLVKSLNSCYVQCFVNYLYNGETEFLGSTEDFFNAFKDWIDFELLPICETKECHILSTKCEYSIELSHQDGSVTCVPQNTDSKQEPMLEEEELEGERTELDRTTLVDAWNNEAEDGVDDRYEDEDSRQVPTADEVPRKCRTSVCHTCGQTFNTLKLFRQHLAVHPDGKIMKCQYCDKGFNKLSQLELHTRIHTGARPHQCHQCGAAFAAKSALNKHVITHRSDNVNKYECDTCSKLFSRKDYLEEHIRAHSGNKPYECSICNKSFVGRTGLNHHKKIHEGSRQKSAVCEVCGKSFTRHSLWTHMKSHMKTHACLICHKMYSTKTALNIHVSSAHLGHRRHQCDVCGKAFVQKNHLVRHMKIHKEVPVKKKEEYTCDKCDESFFTPAKLRTHVSREHTEGGDRPYPCGLCDKRFAGRSTAIYHQRKHTGHLPHACATCGKKFARPDTLQQHSRVHINQQQASSRPEIQLNACSVCNVKCSSKRALKNHLNAHVKESENSDPLKIKNYPCSMCSQSFGSVSQFTTHVQGHALPSYRCETCDKSFECETSLVKHLGVHAVPPPISDILPPLFSFQVCDPVYSQNFANNTITYMHNDENNIVNNSQYDTTVAAHENHPSYTADKQPDCIRRPYSINMDGNLCCNNDEDKLIRLPPENIVVPPEMLAQDIELHQLQDAIPITSVDISTESTPLTLLAVAVSDMIAAAETGSNYVISNN